MLKLMIVDDEYLFREALKISIPWDQLGYEVCCEAENGYDALEKIAEYGPDVAIVDINMPVMDGLELAAEIKVQGLDVRVIIITGYGEFTYARQAIEVGVTNYLLKPIEEDELIKALCALKNSLEKERTAYLETEALARKVDEFRPFLKEMLLKDLMQGNRILGEEEFAVLGNYFNSILAAQSFQVAVIELDEKAESDWDNDARQLYCYAVSNIAEGILKELCYYELCRDINGRLNILLLHGGMAEEKQADVVGKFDRIRQAVVKSLGFTVTVGIGNPYDHIQQLAVSYKEALYAIDNKLIVGENNVLAYWHISEYSGKANIYPIEQRMQMHVCLRAGDVAEAEKIVDAVFHTVRLNNPPGDMVRFVCVQLVSSLLEAAVETGGMSGVFEQGLGILEEVRNKKNLDELESWTKSLLSQYSAFCHTGKGKRQSRIVEAARAYIGENFARFDLKIDEIAKSVFVQYGHLCFVFKRETGKTINEYIGEFRIYKAKELIDGGCQSISLLAAKVGYADANYFSKCFKKIIGVTPGKYMESLPVKKA